MPDKKEKKDQDPEDNQMKEMITIRGPLFEISLGSAELSMNELVELSYKIGKVFFRQNDFKRDRDGYIG